MSAIKIIDVINQKAYGNNQFFIVVDRMPERVYSRQDDLFISNDSGFYDFLAGTQRNGDAFGGRKFTIKLDDGTEWQCNGDMWATHSHGKTEPVIQAGVNTLEGLGKCYVFSACSVSKAMLEEWLSSNTASTEYYKYDKRHNTMAAINSGKLRVVRNAKRRKKLLSRGEGIAWEPLVRAWVWEKPSKASGL